MGEPSVATCVYCGPVPDCETVEQMHAHLASETHLSMVKLRYDHDAVAGFVVGLTTTPTGCPVPGCDDPDCGGPK